MKSAKKPLRLFKAIQRLNHILMFLPSSDATERALKSLEVKSVTEAKLKVLLMLGDAMTYSYPPGRVATATAHRDYTIRELLLGFGHPGLKLNSENVFLLKRSLIHLWGVLVPALPAATARFLNDESSRIYLDGVYYMTTVQALAIMNSFLGLIAYVSERAFAETLKLDSPTRRKKGRKR